MTWRSQSVELDPQEGVVQARPRQDSSSQYSVTEDDSAYSYVDEDPSGEIYPQVASTTVEGALAHQLDSVLPPEYPANPSVFSPDLMHVEGIFSTVSTSSPEGVTLYSYQDASVDPLFNYAGSSDLSTTTTRLPSSYVTGPAHATFDPRYEFGVPESQSWFSAADPAAWAHWSMPTHPSSPSGAVRTRSSQGSLSLPYHSSRSTSNASRVIFGGSSRVD